MTLERLHSHLVDASNALDELRDEDPAADVWTVIDEHIDYALRLVQAEMEPKETR